MPVTADAPHYLTVQEAAALVRVTPRTIRSWIHGGKLPAKRVINNRKLLLVDQRDVLGLLEDARPKGSETNN